MPRRTAIHAGHVIAFDGRGHRRLRDGVVIIEDDRIVEVGRELRGRVDETIDARDRILTPGLISTHAHMGGSPLDRSFIEKDFDWAGRDADTLSPQTYPEWA